jgi:hypothetical protein
MTQTLKYDSRHAIARARFFLQKARKCRIDSREDFEAYIETTIVFAQTALLRLEKKYKKTAIYKTWWKSVKNKRSVKLFRKHRNVIIHEAPPKVGQILKMPLHKVNVTIGGEPEGITSASSELPEEILYASDLYYFEKDPSISATDKVEEHLNELEAYINNFIESLNAP